MKKILKWIGIIFGALIILVVLVVVALSLVGGARLNKTRDIQAEAIPIPTDKAALARGEHLVNTACKSCHDQDLSGQPLIEDPAVATVYATNLTGLSQTHTDADLVRAIRHGIGTDGRQMIIMPAESFINFSAEDLGAIIAYLKTVPPVDNAVPEPQFTFMGRVLMGAGMFGDIFPAEYIDHNQPFHPMPPIDANVEYGQYLSRFCESCHGVGLTGGQPPDPESPPAPNLTTSSHLASWSEADFIQTIRFGVTPEGRQLNSDFMPWESFAKFEDDELKALWMYLSSLSPAQASQ